MPAPSVYLNPTQPNTQRLPTQNGISSYATTQNMGFLHIHPDGNLRKSKMNLRFIALQGEAAEGCHPSPDPGPPLLPLAEDRPGKNPLLARKENTPQTPGCFPFLRNRCIQFLEIHNITKRTRSSFSRLLALLRTAGSHLAVWV